MCAVEFNYKTYFTEEQWKKLTSDVKEECKKDPLFAKQVASELKSGGDPSTIGTQLAYPGGKLKSGPIKGFELERTTADSATTGVKMNVDNLEALKPKYNIADLENDKQLRKTAEAQWEEYFLARAKENPEEAKRDMVRILYNKEVAQIKGGMEEMLKDSKQSKVLKSKYLAEGYATAKEQEAYENKIKQLTEEYKSERGNATAIRDYNALFREQGKNDPIDEGGHITNAQFDALVKLKALDAIEIDGDRLDKMAISAITDQKFNEGLRKANEYQEEIDKLKRESLSPKAKKIQEDAIKKDMEYAKQINKLLTDAETPESIAYRKDFNARYKEMEAKVEYLRRIGKNEEADALEAERLQAKKEAQEHINTLLDQDKLAEANKLTEEQKTARETANKAVYEALDPKVKEKITKLEGKIADAIKDGNADALELTGKNVEKIAKIFAEAQVDKEIAENRYNKTVVHWDKDPSINENDGMRHTYLDNNIREIVQSYPDIFAREPKDGEAPDFTVDGKGYKFDSDKYKEQMLRMANDNQRDNIDSNDAAYGADYLAVIKERKEFADFAAGHSVKAKLKDRRLAGKAYKIAGLDIERDKTVGKRLKHVGVGVFKGAVMGGAAAALAEYLSTTKVVESKFFKIVEYSGSVPFAKMVHYKGETDATLTGKYRGTHHVEGDQAYSQQITVEGDAESYVSFEYSGYKDYYGSKDYSGTVSAEVSGTTPYQTTHTDYYNGIPVGEQVVNVDVPYHDKVNVPYKGTVDYSGTVYYSGEVGGNVKIPYKQVVDVDGTVHWEADVDIEDDVTLTGKAAYEGDVMVEEDVEYKGEVEASGTTVGRPKFDWNNVAKGAITGAIAGGLNAIADWGTIYDEGDRRGSIARKVLSEKNVDGRTAVLRSDAPVAPIVGDLVVPDEEIVLDEQELVGTPTQREEVKESEKCKAEAKEVKTEQDAYKRVLDMRGKLLYDAIAKAYGITDPKELYAAIGVVKGWHGISEAERKKNIWIANLGLKGVLELKDKSGNVIKRFELQPFKRADVDDYDKTDKPGVYRERIPATVESIGGKLVVYCPGEDGEGVVRGQYDNYEDARLAAKYFNEHQEVPTDEQLEEMKNPKKKEEE